MYCEALPNHCPPEEAKETAIGIAYRVGYSDPPTMDDFASHNKLGQKKPPRVDSCKWASCSLFSDKAKAENLTKLPKIRCRNPYLAKLDIPKGSGKWLKGKRSHIDFWMFKSFNPISATLELEKV